MAVPSEAAERTETGRCRTNRSGGAAGVERCDVDRTMRRADCRRRRPTFAGSTPHDGDLTPKATKGFGQLVGGFKSGPRRTYDDDYVMTTTGDDNYGRRERER